MFYRVAIPGGRDSAGEGPSSHNDVRSRCNSHGGAHGVTRATGERKRARKGRAGSPLHAVDLRSCI